MGDVLTLVEKAESAIKEEDAQEMTRRMMSANFDFNDFLKQYKMVSGMGSMGQIMKMLPGGPSIMTRQAEIICLHWSEPFTLCVHAIMTCSSGMQHGRSSPPPGRFFVLGECGTE